MLFQDVQECMRILCVYCELTGQTGDTRCWQMLVVVVVVVCGVYTVSNDSKQFGQAVVMPLSPHISPGKLSRIFPQPTPVLCCLRLGKPVSKHRCNLISFCQIFSKNHIIAHIFGHLSLTKWMQNRGTVTSAPSRSELNVVNQRWHVRMVHGKGI